MTYPGLNPVFATEPMLIGNGIGTTGLATTGVIPRQLVIGWIEEHSLVINVQGLGGFLIVGCGHQPLPNLLQRCHLTHTVNRSMALSADYIFRCRMVASILAL